MPARLDIRFVSIVGVVFLNFASNDATCSMLRSTDQDESPGMSSFSADRVIIKGVATTGPMRHWKVETGSQRSKRHYSFITRPETVSDIGSRDMQNVRRTSLGHPSDNNGTARECPQAVHALSMQEAVNSINVMD